MKRRSLPVRFTTGLLLVALSLAGLTGCEYDLPLTPQPTRDVDPRLVGDWRSTDGKDLMKVRRLDDTRYVVSYNNDLWSGWHSDVADVALVSLLHLDPANRKHSFLEWTLAADGRRLRLRVVSSKVVSKDLRDSAALREAVRRHHGHPEFYVHEENYTRER